MYNWNIKKPSWLQIWLKDIWNNPGIHLDKMHLRNGNAYNMKLKVIKNKMQGSNNKLKILWDQKFEFKP